MNMNNQNKNAKMCAVLMLPHDIPQNIAFNEKIDIVTSRVFFEVMMFFKDFDKTTITIDTNIPALIIPCSQISGSKPISEKFSK